MNDSPPENGSQPEDDTALLEDADLAEDSLPVSVDEAAVPVALNKLAPWHRPRKQYIREKQWMLFSERLLRRQIGRGEIPVIGDDARPEVRYLTLPGIDYLDVRMLAKICRDLGADLTSTGFLAGGEGNPYLARAQVREESLREAGYITVRSHTLPKRLEEVSSVSADAYQEIRKRGPFDIVNIDACGSLARPSAHGGGRLVEAMYRIVELQLEKMSTRWLLFLTTDATKESLSPEIAQQLSEEILKNAKEDADFGFRANEILQNTHEEISETIHNVLNADGRAYVDFFSMGVGKWLLHLAEGKGWSLKMHSSYCYSTTPKEDENPSMPCLAFEFVPPNPGLKDPAGIVRVKPRDIDDDTNYSMRILDKVSSLQDLDEEMAVNNDLKIEMISRTHELLEDAGYTAEALDELNRF